MITLSLVGRESDQLIITIWPLGDAEERSSGAILVGSTREETAHLAASLQLQTLSHDGGQPEGKCVLLLTMIRRYKTKLCYSNTFFHVFFWML